MLTAAVSRQRVVMAVAVWLLVSLSCVVLMVRVADATATASVTELDVSNFDARTKNGIWLVEFFGPRCGHCKKLAPNWEKLAEKVKHENLKFHVAKVDATANSEIAQRLNAYPWPSIQLIGEGKTIAHPESRLMWQDGGVEKLVEFVTKHFPSVKAEL